MNQFCRSLFVAAQTVSLFSLRREHVKEAKLTESNSPRAIGRVLGGKHFPTSVTIIKALPLKKRPALYQRKRKKRIQEQIRSPRN